MNMQLLVGLALASLIANLVLLVLVLSGRPHTTMAAMQQQLTALEHALQSVARDVQATAPAVREEGRLAREEHRVVRDELQQLLRGQQHTLETRLSGFSTQQHEQLVAVRDTLQRNLEQLRAQNDAKLEQMRVTVDEKLQGTLEARLGESFKLVSDRLELVHKGLGEMQSLATGVGDLKRVLTNVKSRGGWGEVQLAMLLDDLLTVEQYATNVRIRPDSGESVEFAVRLPGRSGDAPLLLPIDAKFPQEDYERLLVAHDQGNAEEIERSSAALERAVRVQAKSISEKYVHPPHSTDFAILYLPTEGLFAEVVRRPGLAVELQSTYRVMLTGPTTLAALLTSLQMGFRTLAIEQRSSEVWQVLSAAKAEFRKYGEVWSKLGKQLDTARRTVDEAGRRTRMVEQRLRTVETLDLSRADMLLLPEERTDGWVEHGEEDDGAMER